MALDHTRDYFSNALVNPTDPVQSWPMLFFTRWITHLCAPGFVALAGTSVYLQRQRGRTRDETAHRLVTRGLWLHFGKDCDRQPRHLFYLSLPLSAGHLCYRRQHDPAGGAAISPHSMGRGVWLCDRGSAQSRRPYLAGSSEPWRSSVEVAAQRRRIPGSRTAVGARRVSGASLERSHGAGIRLRHRRGCCPVESEGCALYGWGLALSHCSSRCASRISTAIRSRFSTSGLRNKRR